MNYVIPEGRETSWLYLEDIPEHCICEMTCVMFIQNFHSPFYDINEAILAHFHALYCAKIYSTVRLLHHCLYDNKHKFINKNNLNGYLVNEYDYL